MPPSDELKKELQAHVVKEIGALARPDDIRFTDALPKTRSGKIMRRLLRDIAAGKADDAATRRRWKITACWRSCGRRRRNRPGTRHDVRNLNHVAHIVVSGHNLLPFSLLWLTSPTMCADSGERPPGFAFAKKRTAELAIQLYICSNGLA